MVASKMASKMDLSTLSQEELLKLAEIGLRSTTSTTREPQARQTARWIRDWSRLTPQEKEELQQIRYDLLGLQAIKTSLVKDLKAIEAGMSELNDRSEVLQRKMLVRKELD